MTTLAKNRKASFSYELLDNFEVGLVLQGSEVKSAKLGHIDLSGAHIGLENGELWLKNCYIGPYQPAGEHHGHELRQKRKILIHKRELAEIQKKMESERLTIVPIRVYTKGNFIKLTAALARGKRKHEKRDAIKKRDVERRMREEMKKTRFGN